MPEVISMQSENDVILSGDDVRDRSLFIVQGGGAIEEKLGGPLNFFKPERGALKKYRETKEGGFEKNYQFEKTLVVLKMYHKTT